MAHVADHLSFAHLAGSARPWLYSLGRLDGLAHRMALVAPCERPQNAPSAAYTKPSFASSPPSQRVNAPTTLHLPVMISFNLKTL